MQKTAIFSAAIVLLVLLCAAIVISGCARQLAEAPVIKPLTNTVTCQQLVNYADALVNELENSYGHNTSISGAQKIGTALAFVPVVGLPAAAGSALIGMGRVDTGALRIALDRTRNRIAQMVINGECARAALQ